MRKLKINNENGKDVKVLKISSDGFVGSYPSLALTVFHINMCTVTMFLLLNIYPVHKNYFNFEYIAETLPVIYL